MTTSAFHWAGRKKRYPGLATVFQPRRLYHATTNFFLPERAGTPYLRRGSVKLDITAVQETQSGRHFDGNTSQLPLVEQTKDVFLQYGGEEFYTLMASAEPQPVRLSDDLFEGPGLG